MAQHLQASAQQVRPALLRAMAAEAVDAARAADEIAGTVPRAES
jgi:hypothetical protein